MNGKDRSNILLGLSISLSVLLVIVFVAILAYGDGIKMMTENPLKLTLFFTLFCVALIISLLNIILLFREKRHKQEADVAEEIIQYFINSRNTESDNENKQQRKKLTTEQLAFEITKAESALISLQQQINPHFLYNTLETIRGQALDENAEDIANMIEILARLFRYNVSRSREFTTIKEELENVRDYMTIQNYRFSGRFRLVEEYENSGELLTSFYIPILTLQPIVENAIHHGLEKLTGSGCVTIRIFTTQDKLIISVNDDGVGIKKEDLIKINEQLKLAVSPHADISRNARHSGIALLNVHQRIRLFYGEKYGLNIISTQGVGTTVEIVLPKTPKKLQT